MTALLLGGARFLLVLQSDSAIIQGTVRDAEHGQPLALAVVAVPEVGRSAVTDSAGRYVISHLPSGALRITTHLLGFAGSSFTALLSADAPLEIDIALRAEPVELPDIVSHALPQAGAVPAAADTSLDNLLVTTDRLTIHPLLPEPDLLLAIAGSDVAVQPESPSGLQVLGGAADQTAYLLDGIPVFSPYHSAGIFGAWNPDALAQLSLSSTVPSPASPGSLGGVISALTRNPGDQVHGRGSVSTSQARLTVDGPLGIAHAGFLLSLRSGFLDFRSPKREQDYLRGGTGDWLAKLQLPLLGGTARLLGYGNRNQFDAATLAGGPAAPTAAASRNDFRWEATSLGGEWVRQVPSGALRIQGWNATSDAGATWSAEQGNVGMTAARRDWGLSASLTRQSASARTLVGLRLEQSLTNYLLEYDSTSANDMKLHARTPVATAFVEQSRPLGHRLGVTLGTSIIAGGGSLHLGPRAETRWRPGDAITVTGSFARMHQFAQSLRNPESVVGNVFPVDLHLGAGAGGVPVARSDVLALAAQYRPRPGLSFGAQAYLRYSEDIILVAPSSGDPFATDEPVIGTGQARGISLEAELNRPRYWLITRYRWQSSRLAGDSSSYIPAGAATHSIEGGLTLLPTRTTSIRVGATALLGRRATAVANGLEWEACNLRDRGCEFGGTPHHRGETLGGTSLPAYLRMDLSLRQQWSFEAAGRRTTMAAFGTITNLLGRDNILTYARNPATGQRVPVTMRPRAPLVAGLEWQF